MSGSGSTPFFASDRSGTTVSKRFLFAGNGADTYWKRVSDIVRKTVPGPDAGRRSIFIEEARRGFDALKRLSGQVLRQ